MKIERLIRRLAESVRDGHKIRSIGELVGNELPRRRLDVLREAQAALASAEVDSGSYGAGYVAGLADVIAAFVTAEDALSNPAHTLLSRAIGLCAVAKTAAPEWVHGEIDIGADHLGNALESLDPEADQDLPEDPGVDALRVVYKTDDPEAFGRMPVRTELAVLPADDPNRQIGWTVGAYYSGAEVYLFDVEEGRAIEKPLTHREDLQPGSYVQVGTLIGNRRAVVLRNEDGDLYWDSGGLVGDLLFAQDDRACWVTSRAINKKLLQ